MHMILFLNFTAKDSLYAKYYRICCHIMLVIPLLTPYTEIYYIHMLCDYIMRVIQRFIL